MAGARDRAARYAVGRRTLQRKAVPVAKKTNKAIKKLTKTVEGLRERNEELHRTLTERMTRALEAQAESNRAVLRALEDRLAALEDMRESRAEEPEASRAEPVLAEDAPEDLEVTEAAQQKAEELGVNLENVEGTGSEGRILVKDVEEAARPEED
jgi:pyruvate/2-oxoglutarate dehydrogenase complex dihydrolipoamide acyltransferase (E2) component